MGLFQPDNLLRVTHLLRSNSETMADVDDEQQFEGADAGSSNTYPSQASAVRKNGHIVIKNRPCKVVEMSTSKTGKHGHAKVHFVAIDIFSGKKYEDIVPSTHNVNVPNVNRTDYQLCEVEDGFLSLMDDDGKMREDIKCPDGDLGKNITEALNGDGEVTVTVIKAMGEEVATGVKVRTN